MQSKNNGANELIYKTETDSQGRDGVLGLALHTAVYGRDRGQGDLPWSTGNSTPRSVMTCMGMDVRVWITESR